jgi:hypothetical protein
MKFVFKKLDKYYKIAKKNHYEYKHKHQIMKVIEMFILYICRGIGPGYYLQANGGNKDLKYMLNYLSNKKYIKKVYSINDRLYHRTSMNKMIEKSMLMTYKIPTPSLYGFYGEKCGRSCGGISLRKIEDFVSFLETIKAKTICLKPSSSFGGKGVAIIDLIVSDGFLYIYDRRKKVKQKAEEYLSDYLKSVNPSREDGIIIEEYILQHEDLAKYNYSSVNTIRVMVFLDVELADPVFGAFLRVGRVGSIVDNGTSGGIMVKVDPVTGELGDGCFSTQPDDRFSSHPDTQVAFSGNKLPFWEEIKRISVETVELFPGINYAGLDIAVTDVGPVVVEMNVQPDYVDFALIDVPPKKLFKKY